MKHAMVCILSLSAFLFAAFSCSTVQAEDYTVRIGFEEFVENDHTQIVDQYASQGIHFQDLGDGSGSISFMTGTIAPFGDFNWQGFPPIGLADIGIPYNNGSNANTRYINFDHAASYVSFMYTHSLQSPQWAWPIVAVWDGSNGAGNCLNNNPTQQKFLPGEQLTFNYGQADLWEFSAGTNVIRSITLTAEPNLLGFGDLIIDSAIAPLGGYLEVSSDLDGSANAPSVSMDGQLVFPTFLDSQPWISPVSLISIKEGKHLVSLYAPGYEWYQEYVDIDTGLTTTVNAVMVPAIEPTLNLSEILQADGADLDAGSGAAPYLIDWDDDGLVDLLVGNDVGDILVYINTNTNEAPQYGAPVTVLSATGAYAAPIALEFYHLGKKQLVVGYGDGSVNVYLNTGTDESPAFAGTEYDSTLVTIPGGGAVPFIVDWNNDGEKDLLAGSANGNVYLYLNQRLDASPDYSGATPVVLASVSSHAAPTAVLDWDGDGLKDLVAGAGDGSLNLFLNIGTDEAPLLSAGTPLVDADGQALNVGSYARPIVADYNWDSIKDLIVGNGDGQVILFDGTGGAPPNEPPVADAGGPYVIECEGPSGTPVDLDGSGSADPDSTPGTNDDIVLFEWLIGGEVVATGEQAEVTLALGTHAVTLRVTDSADATAEDTVDIVVEDTTPPELSVSVAPATLWPPNHKMVEITPAVTANDTCDPSPAVQLVSIGMNEGDEENAFYEVTDDTTGDGHTVGDIQVDGEGRIYLRAERAAQGNGRVYTIAWKATDASDNEQTATATVFVPHNQ